MVVWMLGQPLSTKKGYILELVLISEPMFSNTHNVASVKVSSRVLVREGDRIFGECIPLLLLRKFIQHGA
jgi:hypothetical protein